MKKMIEDYFYFTKRERNGLLLLIAISLLFLALPAIVRKFRVVKQYKFEEFRQVMAAANSPVKRNVPSVDPGGSVDLSLLNPQPIDPNFADKEAFLNLGLSPKLVNTILNYRNKGGKFYNSESLKKIYGMTDADYQRILPYIAIKSDSRKSQPKPTAVVVSQPASTIPSVTIQNPTQKFDPNTVLKEELLSFGIPEKIINRMIKFRGVGGKFAEPEDLENVYGMKKAWVEQLLPWMEIVQPERIDPDKINLNKKKVKKKENPITDINTANFEDWQNLIGIGPYYADKIMGYREKLGGFISVDQILETNGLPDSVKQSILPALRTSDIFRKIKINSLSTKEMATHPYITWKEANAISNYRKQHGPFKSRTDLEKMLALQSGFIDRIIFYLDFAELEN